MTIKGLAKAAAPLLAASWIGSKILPKVPFVHTHKYGYIGGMAVALFAASKTNGMARNVLGGVAAMLAGGALQDLQGITSGVTNKVAGGSNAGAPTRSIYGS